MLPAPWWLGAMICFCGRNLKRAGFHFKICAFLQWKHRCKITCFSDIVLVRSKMAELTFTVRTYHVRDPNKFLKTILHGKSLNISNAEIFIVNRTDFRMKLRRPDVSFIKSCHHNKRYITWLNSILQHNF